MKNANTSWRAQKGNQVKYTRDRLSGTAVVEAVLPTTGQPGCLVHHFRIRDVKTNVEMEVTGLEVLLIPSEKKKKRLARSAKFFVSCFED